MRECPASITLDRRGAAGEANAASEHGRLDGWTKRKRIELSTAHL
jgi:hypothetical protein